MYCFNFENYKWNEYNVMQNGNEPSGLGFHSIVLEDRVTLISLGVNLFDIHILNLFKHEWNILAPSGLAPNDMRGFAFAKLEESNKIYIFGGENSNELQNQVYLLEYDFNLLNEKLTLKWYSCQIFGDKPDERTNSTMIALENCLLIFGGNMGGNNRISNEIYIFNEKNNLECEVLDSQGESPLYRAQQYNFSSS